MTATMPVASAAQAPVADQTQAKDLKWVVGVGASAGGLVALEQFFSQLPPQHGMAFLVATHLDPTQPALLSTLLQRCTRLQVGEASEGMCVVSDHVYVIPPNKVMTVSGGRLHLAAPLQPRGLRLPIDLLFESLAQDQKVRAAAVVLSGMGSDGTAGLRAIKTRGGMTLAQDPATAQFDAMPRSAVDSGLVDFQGSPEQLVQHLLASPNVHQVASVQPYCNIASDIASEVSADDTQNLDGPGQGLQRDMTGILQQLANHGHDFSHYKRSTMGRRIERRMLVYKLESSKAYERLLSDSPQEVDLLVNELLIGVTSFFRDRPVWQGLQDSYLPALLGAHADGYAFRAWVVGCSTGEEAYSLAMAFREAQEARPDRASSSLQIFATDLSVDAIGRARRGVFPSRINGEISAQRLQRFFKTEQSDYRICNAIREMVVFAPHDVSRDPPFTKLDLLCCRNLLIYFTAPLQNRLLPLFHYSLRPGGLLMLGSSESIGRFGRLFEPLDSQLRIFRRREGTPASLVSTFPIRSKSTKPPAAKEPSLSETPSSNLVTLQANAEQWLLKEFAPPAVVVNEAGDIVYISGRTGKYLEPSAGRANWNIHVMAREGLRDALQTALRQVQTLKLPVQLTGLTVRDSPVEHPVDVTVRAVPDMGGMTHLSMVMFSDRSPADAVQSVAVAAAVPHKGRRSAALQAMEAELLRAQQAMQTLREAMKHTQEELQASNEELQSTNEELQSTNEELQSTNEELTSSKEELQSMNEELHAVNVELQAKLNELELAQSDMKNLLNSTNIATMFLDKDLNVRRFTEQAQSVFRLRESDIGRPLSDLSCSLDYPGLGVDALEALRTLSSCEKQVPTSDQRWMSVRIMPYRNLEDVILGVVITMVDITAVKTLEAQIKPGPSTCGKSVDLPKPAG